MFKSDVTSSTGSDVKLLHLTLFSDQEYLKVRGMYLLPVYTA